MADIQSNININVDTSNATAAIRKLQAQISAFHQQMQKSGSAANVAASANMQRNLQNSINATGKFAANLTTVKTETEAFTGALEKNKLSMGQYFRYAGASSRTFGRMFRSEFNTISKVAESRVRTLQTQYVKMGRDASGAMKAIAVRPLSLDMKNLSTQTMIAAQKQQIFNQLLRQGSTNLLNFGKNTQWAGRQLMVGFTVPLSIMGATAIKEFQKIEEQVIKLKRVYGDMFTADAETEKAVQQVRQLADEFTKYGIAVESTIGLAASVAQMGNVGADMINQVTEATKLAVLGGMEQEKALDTTISLTNAFGIAAEDLTEKINFLNAAENQTILAIDDFTEAVPKAGSVVAQLGGSVEDLAFFLTAMREGGVNASQAANALKSSLARLINPTQQAQDDLKKLGIDIMSIVEGNVGDLRGTIFDLGDALDQLQPLERSRALEELFGKFQFARMSTLFQNISKEGSQAQEILKLTRNSAAELQVLADRELARVEESPATKLQKSIEKLQAALAPIGAEFVKLVTPIVEFVTGLLKKFNEMGDGAKSFVTGLITVLGLIAPAAIMSFGLIANGIANIMKAFNAYRMFLQKLSGTNSSIATSTSYMTQEQLEAASVAANLGQAHEYLSRQFTVEAGALNQLTDAYNRAIIAQNRFSGTTAATAAVSRPARPTIVKAPTGRRAGSPAGPVGYNKGTLNVPGPRGAGDIVPAVLSPGEAVIPAKQSQKYSGFLEAIMNDEVPGMFFGGIIGRLMSRFKKPGFSEMSKMRQDPRVVQKWMSDRRNKIGVRMSSDNLFEMLASGDSRYSNLFDTGKSAVGDTARERALVEKKLFGIDQSAPGSQRPVYGYMFNKERRVSLKHSKNRFSDFLTRFGFGRRRAARQSFNYGTGNLLNDETFRYGNLTLVPNTKAIKNRTTLTYGDSYNARNQEFANPLPWTQAGKATLERVKGAYTSKDKFFVEAQIMGGFDLNEVDRIITTQPRLKPVIEDRLRKAGYNIPVGLPKYSFMDQIKRIFYPNRASENQLPTMDRRGIYKDRSFAPGYGRMSGTGSDFIEEKGLEGGLFQRLFGAIRGYENGVFSVPGPKGAGDIVPAMLAPGEAVVPAKQTQKYAGLIKGIISDNIPGFEKGTEDIEAEVLQTKGRGGRLGGQQIKDRLGAGNFSKAIKAFSKIGMTAASIVKVLQRMVSALDKAEISFEKLLQILIKAASAAEKNKSGQPVQREMTQSIDDTLESEGLRKKPKQSGRQFAHFLGSETSETPDEVEAKMDRGEIRENKKLRSQIADARERGENLKGKSALGISLDSRLNNQLDKSGGASRSEILSDMEDSGVGKFRETIRLIGGDFEELKSSLDQFDQELQRVIAEDNVDQVFDTDAQAQEYEKRTGQRAGSMESYYKTTRERQLAAGNTQAVEALDKAGASTGEYRVGASGPSPSQRLIGSEVNPELQAQYDDSVKAPTSKKKNRRASRSKTTVKQEAKEEAQTYVNEFTNTVEQAPTPFETIDDPDSDAQAAAAGTSNGRRYRDKMDADQSRAPVPPGQMPTPPGQTPSRRASAPAGPAMAVSPGGVPQPGGYTSPIVDPMGTPEGKRETKKAAKGFVGKFSGKFKNAGASIGKQVLGFVEKSSIGQNVMSGMARAGGNTLVGSDGNVMYDAATDTQYDSQGNVVARGNNIAAGTAAATNRGEAGDISQDVVIGPDGNPVVDKKGRPVSQKQADKQARKMASRQKRGMVAGRLGGAMGSASMMLGMTSMMPGVGDNPIMQQIQGLMPALFGLSAVLPLLAALPGPLGLLVGVVGAVAAGLVMWNMELKKTRKEYRELGESLSSGTKVMDAFAQAAGTVTPTEIMDLRRSGMSEQVQYAAGKSPFATNFFESEDGQSMLSSFEKGSDKFGQGFAAESFSRQLGTAVASGILSREQAGQLALELGNQINDYGVSIQVAAELNEMFGPNGEKLLEGEPLSIFMDMSEGSSEAFESTIEKAIEALDGQGGFFGEFLNLDDAAIEGMISGSLTGFVQESENAYNLLLVSQDKRIEKLQEEAKQLEKNGQDASAKYTEINELREKQEQDRQKALESYSSSFGKVADQISGGFELTDVELAEAKVVAMEKVGYEATDQEYEDALDLEIKIRQMDYEQGILNSFVEGLSASVTENMDEDVAKAVNGAINSINKKEGLSIESKLIYSVSLAEGDIDPRSLELLEAFGGEEIFGGKAAAGAGPESRTKTKTAFELVGEVMLEGGPDATAKLSSIFSGLSQISDEADRKRVTQLLLEDLDGLSGVDLSDTLSQLQFFSTFRKILGEDSMENFLNIPQERRTEMKEQIALMQKLVDETPDEPLTVEQVLEQKVINDPSQIKAFKADSEFFEKLDPVQQFLYIQRFISIEETITNKQAIASLTDKGMSSALLYGGAAAVEDEKSVIATEQVERTFNIEGLVSSITNPEGKEELGSGGGPVGSMLDSLTSKLKLVRDETVKFTKGWSDSMEQLMNLFGDDRRITIFDGIQQQLRSLGAGENLIQLIAGMDPDEFEKRKNELFTIKNGQIVALKDAAISIGDALNSIKIGEFQDKQEATLAQMENQETAFQILKEAGLDVAEAYSIIADEALAAAIATGELTDGELEKLKSQMQSVRESSEIAEALEDARKTIAKFNEDLRIEADIQTYVDSAGFQTISSTLADSPVTGTVAAAAIFKDETLKGLVAAGKAGSAEFVERLKQVLGDSTFMQALFDEGYQNVQTAFQVQEERLRSDFEAMLKAGTLADGSFDDAFGLEELADLTGMTQDGIKEIFNSISDPASVVANAQQEIATLNYEIDDLNAELRDIESQEEDINKKYDDRLEALDKVEKANEGIARAQKSQLTIADALSKGDIAAAARAIQQAREEEAKAQSQSQRDILGEARDAEIEAITSSSGKTREELEQELKDLEDKIATIEEERLEPAQRLLDLSGLLLDKQIEYDEVLNKTKDQWAEIRLGINEAKIASDEFVASMEAALQAKNLVTDTYTPGGSGGGGGGSTTPEEPEESGGSYNIIQNPDGSTTVVIQYPDGSTYEERNDPSNPGRPGGTEIPDGFEENPDLRPKDEDISNPNSVSQTKTTPSGGSSSKNNGGGSSFSGGAGSGGSKAPPKGVNWNENKTGSPEEIAARERSVDQWAEKERKAKESGDKKAAEKAKYFKEKNKRLLEEAKGMMSGGVVARYAMGGLVNYKAGGGVMPSQKTGAGSVGYLARGGGIGKMFRSINTDTVPAMLTAGEFVVRKSAVDKYGASMLKSVNNGTYSGGSVYNYSVNVNVKSDANPNEIARTVMSNINRIDAQRMRSNRF